MTAGGNILNCYRHYRSVKLNISDVVPKKAKKTDTMFQKDKFKLHFGHCFDLSKGGSRGRVQGVCTPPPLPEMTCGFLIQLVFCKKKKKTMCFIGIEVEQETSAPPPKKDPGSAPAF